MPRSAVHSFCVALVAALGLAALGGCSALTSETPPLSDSTMVEVLIELHLAQARQKLHGDLTPARRDSILAAYDLDQEAFDAAMTYYAEHPAELAEIYRRALDRLGEERPPQQFDFGTFQPDSSRVER